MIFHSINLENICIKGGYSYANMAIDPETSKDFSKINMFYNSEDKMFEAVFFPHRPSENPSLVVNATIAGIERELTCAIAPKSSKGFESGKRYTLTITLTSNSISTGTVNISTKWEEDEEDNSFVTE